MSYNMVDDPALGPDRSQSAVMFAAAHRRVAFIQKVYGYLLLGIVAALAAGALVVNSPARTITFDDGYTAQIPTLVATIGSMGFFVPWLVIFGLILVAGKFARHAVGSVVMLCVIMAAMGAYIAPQLWAMSVSGQGNTIGMAGALTGLIFVGISAFAWFTKKDFNFLGAGLTVALLGAIGGSLLNAFFFHAPWAHMLIAWAILIIASGFVLYDTQNIMKRLPEDMAAFGALMLLIDIWNIFIALLSILSGGRR